MGTPAGGAGTVGVEDGQQVDLAGLVEGFIGHKCNIALRSQP